MVWPNDLGDPDSMEDTPRRIITRAIARQNGWLTDLYHCHDRDADEVLAALAEAGFEVRKVGSCRLGGSTQ